jgi:hypothetical protein
MKGSASARGRIQVRVGFTNQFEAAFKDDELSPYEQGFCNYFGTRRVDEALARSIAPSIVYFHLSPRRLLRGQMRRAFWRATCGLVTAKTSRPDAKGGREGESRARCYLAFTSSLWAAVALAAGVYGTMDPSEHQFFIALACALGAALITPSPAHVAARLCWHRVRDLDVEQDRDYGPDADRPAAAPPVLAMLVLLASWFTLFLVLALLEDDRVLIDVGVAAGCVVLLRALVLPASRGFILTVVVSTSKRSRIFDKILRLYPSLLTAHDGWGVG